MVKMKLIHKNKRNSFREQYEEADINSLGLMVTKPGK